MAKATIKKITSFETLGQYHSEYRENYIVITDNGHISVHFKTTRFNEKGEFCGYSYGNKYTLTSVWKDNF